MPDVEVVDERYQAQNGQTISRVEGVQGSPKIATSASDIPAIFEPKDNSERTQLEQELLGVLQHKQPEGFGWIDLTTLKFLGIADFTALALVPTDTLKLTLAKAKAMLAESHVGKAGKLFP
jgi:hypothetical protein